MSRDDIITKVREKLDEVTPFENAIVDDVDLIDKVLDEAAIKLLMVAPLHTIRGYKMSTSGYTENMDNDDKGIGCLPLPSDFLRLHGIKVSVWQRVVTRAYDDTSHMANLQKSIVTRGGYAKPVCILSYTESSTSDSVFGLGDNNAGFYYERVLYLYSVPDNATFDVCSYVPRLLPEQLQSNLIDSLSWQCAGDVLTITGNPDQAAICFQHIQKFIKDNTLE